MLRLLVNRDYENAASALATTPDVIEKKLTDYYTDHRFLSLDQKARSLAYSRLTPTEQGYRVEQTLCDPRRSQRLDSHRRHRKPFADRTPTAAFDFFRVINHSYAI